MRPGKESRVRTVLTSQPVLKNDLPGGGGGRGGIEEQKKGAA